MGYSPNTAHLVQYQKEEVYVVGRLEEPVEVLVVNIHKSLIGPEKDYFRDLLPFVHAQNKGSFRCLSSHPIPLGHQMRQIIEELAQKKYSGCFLGHFIEIKILELLLLFINEGTELKEQLVAKNPNLNQRVVRQMEQVRSLLLQNLSETPTLKALAGAVGTNEFHLKLHFKAYFGKTVMGYLRDYKMDLAKKQLTGTDWPIGEIAEQLGYKHATHFSAAFKKYHGKLPKEFR